MRGIVIAAVVVACLSFCGVASGSTADRGGKLPMLTQPDAVHHARTATRGKFGNAFDYGMGTKVGCGNRLSRVRIRCKLKWYLGDVAYRGHVTVYYRWKRGDVWWFTKGDFKVINAYCMSQGGSKSHCTDHKGWGR